MSSPDSIYWRRTYKHPEIEYIRLENLHFWQGNGLSVDGFYYWLRKGDTLADPQAIVKRIPRSVWLEWGRRRHRPPEEKGNYPSMRLELFTQILDAEKVFPHEPEAKT